MANEPVVVIEGATELALLLRRTGDRELQAMLRVANKRAAEVVVQKALPHVPVGTTGRLKDSVRATGAQAFGEARAGNAQVPYAAAIHWGRGTGNTNYKHGRYARGTKGGQRGGPIKGRPFLKDAADSSLDQITGVYLFELKKVLAAMRLPTS